MYLETKKGVDKYMSKNIIGLFSKSKMKLEKRIISLQEDMLKI